MGKMESKRITLILLIALLVLILFKVRTKVTSTWYPGNYGDKPPWRGKPGDVVYWGGKTWAWMESPIYGNDWFEIGSVGPQPLS
jgi:hypothetical protein